MSNNSIGSGVGFLDPSLMKQNNELTDFNVRNKNNPTKQLKKIERELKLEQKRKEKRNRIYK